jgi:hypothetical protein
VETNIAKFENLAEIVHTYTESIKLVVAAYALLDEAQGKLERICSMPSVLPNRYGLHEADLKKVLGNLKSKMWRAALRKTKAVEFMTESRYRRFEKSLDDPSSLPEITEETVKNFVSNVLDSAPDMLLEFIREVFDWLKPGNFDTYKTNKKNRFEISEKVIRGWCFSQRYGGKMELMYTKTSSFNAMDNAFHLMDGKGLGKSNLVSVIGVACREGKNSTETEYFKLKWFKNGNCHIVFKRMDLVAKLNKIAGENLLREGD